jgi:antirestriction protein ArdC
VNILVLGSAEYTSRYWLTFREAQRQGGHVRKGERATPVVYWKICSAPHIFQYVVKWKMW